MSRPLHSNGAQLYIERDDDCDCPWWLRWRIVAYDYRSDSDTVLAHTRTKLGAWWKRRGLAKSGRVVASADIIV